MFQSLLSFLWEEEPPHSKFYGTTKSREEVQKGEETIFNSGKPSDNYNDKSSTAPQECNPGTNTNQLDYDNDRVMVDAAACKLEALQIASGSVNSNQKKVKFEKKQKEQAVFIAGESRSISSFEKSVDTSSLSLVPSPPMSSDVEPFLETNVHKTPSRRGNEMQALQQQHRQERDQENLDIQRPYREVKPLCSKGGILTQREHEHQLQKCQERHESILAEQQQAMAEQTRVLWRVLAHHEEAASLCLQVHQENARLEKELAKNKRRMERQEQDFHEREHGLRRKLQKLNHQEFRKPLTTAAGDDDDETFGTVETFDSDSSSGTYTISVRAEGVSFTSPLEGSEVPMPMTGQEQQPQQQRFQYSSRKRSLATTYCPEIGTPPSPPSHTIKRIQRGTRNERAAAIKKRQNRILQCRKEQRFLSPPSPPSQRFPRTSPSFSSPPPTSVTIDTEHHEFQDVLLSWKKPS